MISSVLGWLVGAATGTSVGIQLVRARTIWWLTRCCFGLFLVGLALVVSATRSWIAIPKHFTGGYIAGLAVTGLVALGGSLYRTTRKRAAR